MAVNSTLNGFTVTRARVSIPAWGAWFADVSIDSEQSFTGSATLQLADLTLKGAVLSGGTDSGRSHYRIVAGAGGWGKALPKKSYANDAGVKLSTVLTDAAAECGETIDVSTSTDRVGPAYVRPEGPACRALEVLAPSAWYVDEAGTTRLGRRLPSMLDTKVPRTSNLDLARGTITLAPDAIAGILPGIVVDGLTSVDVVHELSAEAGLRTTIWGRQGGGSSRRLTALRALFDQLDPERKFRGMSEYRVVTQEGNRLNLQPVRVSTGMPDLQRVPVRPGLAGAKSTLALGARVLVGFADADPARPFVSGLEDADGGGFLPLLTAIDAQLIKLGAGTSPVPKATPLLQWAGLVETALASAGHPVPAPISSLNVPSTKVFTE